MSYPDQERNLSNKNVTKGMCVSPPTVILLEKGQKNEIHSLLVSTNKPWTWVVSVRTSRLSLGRKDLHIK